ncbi:MAG: hypothetical protein JXR10_06210 [Cyclobacteriaceae bacterium]
MRSTTSILLILLTLSVFASDPNLISARIKIDKNEEDKIYTVFFADTVHHNVSVQLKNKNGLVITEKEIFAAGFSKRFALSELRNGEYEFLVSFEGIEYSETIRLKSAKELLAERVQIKHAYPILEVKIKPDNLAPIDIQVYDKEDNLLKVFYWEPNENYLVKKINIGQFEGFEARVKVVQEKEEKLDQMVTLY